MSYIGVIGARKIDEISPSSNLKEYYCMRSSILSKRKSVLPVVEIHPKE